MVLTQNRIEEIEVLAEATLDEALNKSLILPVNINAIVAYYDLTLKVGKFENPEIVGSYQRSEKTIYISNSDPYTRTSFTIAHELGHFLLHQDMPSEVFYRASTYQPNVQDSVIEAEANCFAACLLMPRVKMKIFYPLLSDDLGKLAELFGVSKIAMNYRVKNIGL